MREDICSSYDLGMSARQSGTDPVDRALRIEHCPAVQTNVRWPFPVDQRLNELLERLADVGAECTRSQLVAALVAAAPSEADKLKTLLEDYRRQTAGAVVLQSSGPLVAADRRPGRRPR